MQQYIDPSILIGIDAGSPDSSFNNWLPEVLAAVGHAGTDDWFYQRP